MAKLGVGIALFLLALAALRLEYAMMARIRATLPLRVGVTGTRGKSSVTRLIASGLRGTGRRVVAKTTGSRPMFIAADGSESVIRRTGPASILEQRSLLRFAAREKVEGFVAEIMSVHPENQAVESEKILGINLCVITNARADHVAEQGDTPAAVARSLAVSIPQGGVVVCAHGADLPEIRAEAGRRRATLIVAPPVLRTAPASAATAANREPALPYLEFDENIALAVTVCSALGADPERARIAMRGVVPDLGALRLWSWTKPAAAAAPSTSTCTTTFANGFAANDPESSQAVLRKIREAVPGATITAAILNLRADRPERSAQWIGLLRSGGVPGCDALYVIGPGAGAVVRRAGAAARMCTLRDTDPGHLIARIEAENPGNLLIVGLGNIAGAGRDIVDYCSRKGASHES